MLELFEDAKVISQRTIWVKCSYKWSEIFVFDFFNALLDLEYEFLTANKFSLEGFNLTVLRDLRLSSMSAVHSSSHHAPLNCLCFFPRSEEWSPWGVFPPAWIIDSSTREMKQFRESSTFVWEVSKLIIIEEICSSKAFQSTLDNLHCFLWSISRSLIDLIVIFIGRWSLPCESSSTDQEISLIRSSEDIVISG